MTRAIAPRQRLGVGERDRECVRRLVEAAQAGDSVAWHQLYEMYRSDVLNFIRYRVSGEAEDLASDVWVRALKNLHRFTWQGQDLGAWLITIARNIIVDHWKSARIRYNSGGGGGELLSAEDSVDGYEVDPHQPDNVVIGYLTGRVLWSAVTQLNPLQRRCIELRFACGLNVAETAAAMDCNEGAIKALQYRAVRALARQLKPAALR